MKIVDMRYIIAMRRDRKLHLHVFNFRKNHKLYGRCQVIFAKDEQTARRMMKEKYGEDDTWWYYYNEHTWDEYERLMTRYGQKQNRPMKPILYQYEEEE